jgi:anti-anti-sigma factor
MAPPEWHSTFAADADTTTATVHARGALDLLTVEVLRGTVDVITTAGHSDVTIDLTELESIDQAGLVLLGTLRDDLERRGGSLELANANATVRQALLDGQISC